MGILRQDVGQENRCTAPDFLDRYDAPYSSGRFQRKALSWLNRGLEVQTLDQPVLVVERAKFFPIRSTGSLPLHLTASDSGLILG